MNTTHLPKKYLGDPNFFPELNVWAVFYKSSLLCSTQQVHNADLTTCSPSDPVLFNNKADHYYFLFTATFWLGCCRTSITIMVDSGAGENLIKANIADVLDLPLGPPSSVLGAGSIEIPCHPGLHPLNFETSSLSFNKHFSTIKNLVFLAIMGIRWWRRLKVNINTTCNVLTVDLEVSKGEIPLQETPVGPMKIAPKLNTLVNIIKAPAQLLPPCLEKFALVFDMEVAKKLPPHSKYNLGFKLVVNLVKINSFMYPLSELENKALDVWVDNMLECEYIYPKPLAVTSPVLFGNKSDGSLRPCTDYSLLINVIVPNKHPLPLPQNIAQSICKSRVFSKLDLVGAFNQIRVKEGQE